VAFSLHPQQQAESDTELNAPKMMVGNAVAFFYPGESSSEVPPPDAKQPTDKVSGDNSRQHEAVSEHNSWDFDVPIPSGRLGRSGRGLRSDLQQRRSLEAC
jgi:hypothetical protein